MGSERNENDLPLRMEINNDASILNHSMNGHDISGLASKLLQNNEKKRKLIPGEESSEDESNDREASKKGRSNQRRNEEEEESSLKILVLALQSEMSSLRNRLEIESEKRRRVERKMKEVVQRLNEVSGHTNHILSNQIPSPSNSLPNVKSIPSVTLPPAVVHNVSPPSNNSNPVSNASSPLPLPLPLMTFPTASQVLKTSTSNLRTSTSENAEERERGRYSRGQTISPLNPLSNGRPNANENHAAIVNRVQQMLMNTNRIQLSQEHSRKEDETNVDGEESTRPSAIQLPPSEPSSPVQSVPEAKFEIPTEVNDDFDQEYIEHIATVQQLSEEQATKPGKFPAVDFYKQMELVAWLNMMARKYKKGLVSAAQISPLSHFGFKFKEMKKITPWHENFEKLKTVKDETGGFDVRSSSLKGDKYLLHWIRNTRTQYEKGTLTPARVDALRALGFIYTNPDNILHSSIPDVSIRPKVKANKNQSKKKEEVEDEDEGSEHEGDSREPDLSNGKEVKPSKKAEPEEDEEEDNVLSAF